MANDVSVRSYLLGKGYSNDDIGYDPNSGQVQLKNKTTGAYDNFFKPSMNVNGSTYDNQSNIDNAYNQYAKTQQQPTQVGQPAQTQANPYIDQYTQMIKDIQSRLAAPQQDVYSTPQYAAAQAQAQRGVAEGQRQSRENLNRRGIFDSSLTSSQANQIAANSNEYLQTQLVPQIQQQLTAQRQAEISNQFNLLNPVMSLLSRDDSLKQNDISNRIAKSGVTGYYDADPTDVATIRQLMDRNSAAYGAASPEEQQRLHAENVKLAASIGGTDTTGNGDYAYGPMRTIQGQQMDYNQQADQRDFGAQEAQRQWDNTFKEGQFDYQKAADLWERNFKDKSFEQSVRQAAQGLGMDYSRMNQSQQQFAAEMAYKYKALEQSQSKSEKPDQFKLDDYKGYINQNFYKETPSDPNDPYSKTVKSFDGSGARKYIIGLGLSDAETDQLLKLNNLPTN